MSSMTIFMRNAEDDGDCLGGHSVVRIGKKKGRTAAREPRRKNQKIHTFKLVRKTGARQKSEHRGDLKKRT